VQGLNLRPLACEAHRPERYGTKRAGASETGSVII